MAHGAGERRAGARMCGHGEARGAAGREAAVRAVRPRRVRGRAAVRAVGWDAPAGGARTDVPVGARAVAARRAVRIARPDDAWIAAGVARGRAARRAAHGPARHARRPGGAVPGRSRGDLVAAPRPGPGRDRRADRATASATRDDHEPGVRGARKARARRARGRGSAGAVSVRRILPPALLLVLAILLWQGVASLPGVDDLTLASPVETWHSLVDDRTLLFDEAGTTVVEVLLGLAISAALGFGIAVVMHLVRPVRDAAYPLLLASQAIPIVVLAPLFILAFGYGIGPKLAIVALICFFPIVVNVLDGLRSVDPDLLKLMRSLEASRWARLWKAELPSSLPFLFSGLKIAATVSVIGAVFGEWAGADHGLGRLVLLSNNQLQTPRVYAGTVLLTLMAIALFAFVSIVERVAIPWRREQ